ncbi:MAG: hypothetical protein H6746_18730 [Deltaproteobacteria bacterium]|nr:hypothetical protein [Deltaproteobacteria bacterium]
MGRPDYALLDAAWREVLGDLGRGAWSEAAGRQSRVIELGRDLGLPNLPQLSAVLLRAADDAARDGAVDGAESLASAAVTLSPDLVAPRVEKTRYLFQRTPFALATQIREIRRAFENLRVDLPALLAFAGNAVTATSWVIILLLVAFAFAMVLRYFRFAASDLRRLLPRGVTQAQTSLLLFVLLLAPFFAGLGVLCTAGVWLCATALYQRTAERVATVILVVGMAALPRLSTDVLRALSFPATAAATIDRCATGPCTLEEEAEVVTYANTHRHAFESNFTAALTLARDGRLDATERARAESYARTALELTPGPEILTLRGNLAYFGALEHCGGARMGLPKASAQVEASFRDAIASWEQARALEPSYLPATYNAAVTHLQLGDEAEGQSLLESALALDPSAVATWNKEFAREQNLLRCRETELPARHLMPPRLPTDGLLNDVFAEDLPAVGLIVPYAELVTARIGVRGVLAVAIATLVICLLMWTLSRTIRPSRPCRECDAVADPRTRLDLGARSICERCLLTDIRRSFADPKEQWFRDKERELARARSARRARWLSWFLPGIAQLLRGAPLRGLLFLGLMLACGIAGLALNVVVDDPVSPSGIGAGRLAFFGTIAALTWLVSVIDAHSARGA